MEAILNNLIKATGWSIFHSLWQGAVIYAILLLAVNTFPKLTAKSKHNLAYGSLMTMFVTFILTFLTIFRLPALAAQSKGSTVSMISQRYKGFYLSWPAELNNRAENMFPYIVAIYIIGLLLQLFILGKGYLKLEAIKKEGHEQAPEDWQIAFLGLIEKLGLRKEVKFRLSTLVNVPLVVGYLKPMVLFPVALVAQLDIHQVEAILIHELSHIRRNDYLLNLIKTAVETILFFNPFVWLSSKLIDIEREHACDDLVLKITGTPVTYAHALLKLEILKEKGSPALAMASTGKNHYLYQRIKRITDMKTNYINSKQQFLAVALTVATVISLAWVSPAKDAVLKKVVKKVLIGKEAKLVNGIPTPIIEINIDTVPVKTLKSDTTKKKRTIKIVTVDGKGNKVVYNSVDEVPDSLKFDVITGSNSDADFKNFDFDFKTVFKGLDTVWGQAFSYLKSPEYKKEVQDAMSYIKSPEYAKEVQEAMNYMKSPEYKKEMRDAMAHLSSPAFKKELKESTEATRQYLNSTEFIKQQLESMKSIEQMKKSMSSKEFKSAQENFQKSNKELRLKYSGPELQKQIEALKDLKGSDEYKQLKEKFDKDIEKLKEKKGIKTDLKIGSINSIMINPSSVNKS
ncbi:MAG: peptidase M56 [Flavobacterium sp.]|nr:MAG: peptidase M56 [Flavobacterium sp.]